MPTQLLVVDANHAFATMIKQVLEDQGDYRASIAGSAGEAIELAARIPFDLAVVDMGLPDVPGADAIRGLRATRPALAIIAIPFETDSTDPLFRTLDVQGFLTKPFFIPDLPGIVEDALTQPVGGVAPPARQRTALKTALSAATPQPSAPSPATRRPSPLIAPPPPVPAPKPRPAEPTPPWLEDVSRAAQYLTTLTLQTAAEATLLTRGPRLIAYAGQFPKEEAEELARIVHDNWTKDGGQGTLMRFIKLSATGADYVLYATAATSDIVLAMAFQAETPMSMIRKQARKIAESLRQPPANHAPSVEPPSPPAPTPPPPRPPAPDLTPPPPAPPPASPPLVETASPEPTYEWLRAAPQVEVGPMEVEPPPPAPQPEVLVDVGLQLPIETTPPGLARTPHALYNLTYSFVWLPKFPKTRLIGDVAVRLDEWIRHTALAYDWRVERVEVRADCVVLIAMCPPATAPERVVRVLKRATSEKVFAEFPRHAAEHPAGDFWAPGYLLIGPGQTPTPQQIADFIAYTRREQGLER